jgi:peptidyl-prolyl cis-trans isomerase SurA
MLDSSISHANEKYKIIVKVNDEIVSNYDVEMEKNYLSALNPKILSIPTNEIKKIAKQSLIREIIKKNEVSKYYDVDYASLENLNPLAEKLYKNLGIESEEEFKIYLKKYNLELKDILIKLAIESNWNALIYEKYKDQVNIDKDKIKKKLKKESNINIKEKLFLLSEIVFTAKNKEEYKLNYQKIINTIKDKDFKSAATIYSLSDTAKFGGKIGWIGKKDISEKIYKHISILKINEITKPIKIGTGFLILNLDNTKEEKREGNLEENFNKFIFKETNRQLNEYSIIYFKKIEKQSFIYED